MNTLYKTKNKGTLGAWRWQACKSKRAGGIALGIYDKENFASLEEDSDGNIKLTILKGRADELGVKIEMIDGKEWLD